MLLRSMVILTLFGQATYYRDGLMEAVFDGRLAWDKRIRPCEHCLGSIAIQDCSHLGDLAWVTWPDSSREGPFEVVDCGPFLTPGRVVEFSRATARRVGGSWPLDGVRVDILCRHGPDEPVARNPNRVAGDRLPRHFIRPE